MSDIEICPQWWPELLWKWLHRKNWPGPPPPNDGWPIVEDLLTNLHVHMMSYAMKNQEAAKQYGNYPLEK